MSNQFKRSNSSLDISVNFTNRNRKCTCNYFEYFEFYALILLLDLGTRQSMLNQNKAVLVH